MNIFTLKYVLDTSEREDDDEHGTTDFKHHLLTIEISPRSHHLKIFILINMKLLDPDEDELNENRVV